MNAPLSIEDRLSAALSARAEQVQVEDLSPASPPATVTPLRRRTRPVMYAAAAAAVAAAAVVATVVVTSGTDTAGPGPAAPTTVVDSSAPAPTPSQTPTAGRIPTDRADQRDLAALMDEDSLRFADTGTEVRFASGARGSIDDGELVVSDQGTIRRVTLDDRYQGAALSRDELQLGQAGVGYLVALGDIEEPHYVVYVLQDDQLVAAAVTADVPFGSGFGADDLGYVTSTTGGSTGIYTRVQANHDYDSQRYRVYRWEVGGPGEGGGAPDATTVELTPTDLGVLCFDFNDGSVERC